MMKIQFFFLFCFRFFALEAQSKDITLHSFGLPDNHYGPFHQTIKDTTKKTVSTFGQYLFLGIGETKNYSLNGLNRLLSYSFAYKSHLISLTYCDDKHLALNSAEIYYKSAYYGLLVGESIRYKYLFVSLSAGVGRSSIFIYDPKYTIYNNTTGYYEVHNINQNTLTIPVEFKLFFLARNAIGVGFQVTENFLSPNKYSPYYVGISLVFGRWNIAKHKTL